MVLMEINRDKVLRRLDNLEKEVWRARKRRVKKDRKRERERERERIYELT